MKPCKINVLPPTFKSWCDLLHAYRNNPLFKWRAFPQQPYRHLSELNFSVEHEGYVYVFDLFVACDMAKLECQPVHWVRLRWSVKRLTVTFRNEIILPAQRWLAHKLKTK